MFWLTDFMLTASRQDQTCYPDTREMSSNSTYFESTHKLNLFFNGGSNSIVVFKIRLQNVPLLSVQWC